METKKAKVTPAVPEAKKCKTADEVSRYVADRVAAISAHKSFSNQDVQDNLEGISRVYWDLEQYRAIAAEALVEHGFAEVLVKMLTYYNEVGVFRSDATWFPCYFAHNITWNFTDCSSDFCLRLSECGLMTILLSNLTCKDYLNNVTGSENVTYLMKASLGILSNIARNLEAKYIFAELNAVEAVKPFTDSSDDLLKMGSMLLLTNIISEKENATLEDTGVTAYIVDSIRSALEAEDHRCHGFSAEELTEGLGRMAANETNQMQIVERGALPLFVKMMKGNDPEEQQAAVETLWSLYFAKEAVRKRILSEPDFMTELERLSKAIDDNLRNAATGLLWTIKKGLLDKVPDPDGKEKRVAKSGEAQEHVFISYNWYHQKIILKIAKRLQADGYKVWIDVDEMGGSTMQAMASAIENAALVLVTLSEKYQLSPNCRLEAEYTCVLNKPVIPLMMQSHFKADGWLGLLAGAKLYYNFACKADFETIYADLVKGIERQLGATGNDTPDKAPKSSLTGTTPSPKTDKSAKVKSWTQSQVADWLQKQGLGSLTKTFADYDGSLLIQLNQVRHEAPEFFYRYMCEKKGMDMVLLLKFVKALSDLGK